LKQDAENKKYTHKCCFCLTHWGLLFRGYSKPDTPKEKKFLAATCPACTMNSFKAPSGTCSIECNQEKVAPV